MKPSQSDRLSLRAMTMGSGADPGRFIADRAQYFAIDQLVNATSLGCSASDMAAQAVLLHVERQLSAAQVLLELDGIAGRIVICPPGLPPAQLPGIIAKAGIDIVLTDNVEALRGHVGETLGETRIEACGVPARSGEIPHGGQDTEWLLFTSGTTGIPKMVRHTLKTLTGPMQNAAVTNPAPIWSSFYDIRRYGGLTILLRALVGGGSLLLSDAQERVSDFLARLGAAGVNNISGTPSHWRLALMSREAAKIAPSYIRLSGEIADQAILDNLQRAFPAALISHAFASTEAGVGFDVRDRLSGFPAAWIGRLDNGVEMKIKNGFLLLRSSSTSSGYVGEPARSLLDDDGFVDTGDQVELRGDRLIFSGRREGIINVGGLKVHPEEVEAVINQHPGVRMSRVKAKTNPVTGSVVAADIVLRQTGGDFSAIRQELSALCRDRLQPYQVPALFKNVPALEITAAGKLSRHGP